MLKHAISKSFLFNASLRCRFPAETYDQTSYLLGTFRAHIKKLYKIKGRGGAVD
jgi:hypothetical protein